MLGVRHSASRDSWQISSIYPVTVSKELSFSQWFVWQPAWMTMRKPFSNAAPSPWGNSTLLANTIATSASVSGGLVPVMAAPSSMKDCLTRQLHFCTGAHFPSGWREARLVYRTACDWLLSEACDWCTFKTGEKSNYSLCTCKTVVGWLTIQTQICPARFLGRSEGYFLFLSGSLGGFSWVLLPDNSTVGPIKASCK